MSSAVLLFAVALAARLAAGVTLPSPAYPDSFYYVNVARELAAGNGFSVDYIWNFVDVGGRLPERPELPIPSNAHWMPLAALVQVPLLWLLGPSPVAAALPFWVIGAAAAPITYLLGRDAGLRDGVARAGGLLAALPGGLTPFLAQPDNFALFMTLGALALWAAGRALRGDSRAFALGGLLVGLATLSRNDGVLLAVPFVLAFLRGRAGRVRTASSADSAPRIGWQAAVACLAGFLVVVGPWYARQLAVFGSLSPSAANGRILWITSYEQLYSVASETTLTAFLAQGPVELVASRLLGLTSALAIFATVPLLLFLLPFTLVGAWGRRRDPLVASWAAYAAALFAVSGLLFAVHVPHGTFLHSAVALVPHAYLLAALGIGHVVAWTAARRPSWDAARATRQFSRMAVAVMLLAAIAATWRVHADWRAEAEMRETIASSLRSAGDDGLVMSPDPGAYRYLAARRGIVTPDDPLPVIESALRAYRARWLVLERDHLVAALAPVLADRSRPGWLSPPVASVGQGTPLAALYAVCLEAGDPRCGPS